MALWKLLGLEARTNDVQVGAGPLILSWINEICSDDTEKRAILLAAANDFAYIVEAVVSHGTSQLPPVQPRLSTNNCDDSGSQLRLEDHRISQRTKGLHMVHHLGVLAQ